MLKYFYFILTDVQFIKLCNSAAASQGKHMYNDCTWCMGRHIADK